MKFETPIAYTKLDKQNEFFSPKALKKVANTTKLPIPVTPNFDYRQIPIGRVTDLKFKKDRLIATIELLPNVIKDDDISNYCFRVSGALKESRKTKIKINSTVLSTEIQEIELLTVGLINKAIDVYEKEYK